MTTRSPEDGARFRQVLRGYDKAEVDAAIVRLERALADLGSELERTRSAPADPVVPDVGPRPGREAFARDLASLLDRAEEIAEAEVARARVEAEAIRRGAMEAAEEMRVEAAAAVEVNVGSLREDAERAAEGHIAAAAAEADRLRADAVEHAKRVSTKAASALDAAKVRVDALEERRTELLAELESLRDAINEAEGRLPVRPASRPATKGVVEQVDRTETQGWVSAVRIIPPEDDADEGIESVDPALGSPVSALEVMEEVRRLHEPPPVDPGPEPEPGPGPTPEPEQQPTVAVGPVPETLGQAAESDAESDAEPEGDTEVAVPEAPEQGTEPGGEPETDVLGGLFAELRTGATAPSPPPEPEERTQAPPVNDRASEPSGNTVAARPGTAVTRPDPRRPLPDRAPLLIPITNSGLRSLKRELADLQNHALEGLRLDPDGWRPSRAEIDAPLSVVLAEVRGSAYRAAVALVAADLGEDHAVFDGTPSGDGSATAGDLAASLERALARGTDGPSRSAEISRVFRAWRADGAERHLRSEATRAFNEGVRDAAAAADVGVEVVVGRSCPACTEAAEAGGTPIPPVHDGCRCALVVVP